MLKKIGEILHLSRSKKLVVRLTTVPPLYITVYDYGFRRVGVLYDVIGPLSRPFGLVRPDANIINNVNEFIGKDIYVRLSDLDRRRRTQSV